MKNKIDAYLLILLILLIIFVVFWVEFGNWRYEEYKSGYWDIGSALYSFYWHANEFQYYTNPLQYLVFMNHISFLTLFLVPIYTLYQHPITIFLIQDVSLAISVLVLYFICSDLLKSRKIGFTFAIVFLSNPCVLGLVMFDFHLEAFTVLFYLLSFYFYFKKRVRLFVLSFVLLIGVLEVDSFVAGSLIMGLLLYELLHNKEVGESKKRYMLGMGFFLVFAALVFYYLLTSYIQSTYVGGPNPPIVPLGQAKNYILDQERLFSSGGPGKSYNFTLEYTFIITIIIMLGLFVMFLGFGLTSFISPLISIVLYSPWWGEMLLSRNFNFGYPYFQYYSFGLGGSILSAILGMKIIKERKHDSAEKFFKSTNFENLIAIMIVVIGFAISLAVFVEMSPASDLLNLTTNIYSPSTNYATSIIPANMSVMAQGVIAPHLYYIHNLELSPSDKGTVAGLHSYWTLPDYIILNKHLPDYADIVNSIPFNQNNFSEEYTVYFNQSGTYIYRRH
jgi:uncharacterized membrane protein